MLCIPLSELNKYLHILIPFNSTGSLSLSPSLYIISTDIKSARQE